MAKSFCVSLTHCHSNGDEATVAFVVANAALGSEQDTTVFLSGEGVRVAAKGEAEKVVEDPPFAPLKDLVDKFLAGGGKILACSPCLKKRGITEDQMIEGAQPAGGATLVEILSNGAPCVSF
ncbi:MAG: DsrE family protein [Planctomycetes bacterium]|nr:DsrE family protein [Planctomycetota bacterium]